MFAYCGNNPVNMLDNGGEFALSIGTMLLLAGAGAFLLLTATVFTTPSVQQGISNTINSIGASISSVFSKSDEQEQTKSDTKDIAKSKVNNNQAYFTANPYDFNPKGLVRTEYAGTKNGRIIEWRDPTLDVKIFEWNEDLRNGSHYHAMKIEWDGNHDGIHYLPGTPVPEPWNSVYF